MNDPNERRALTAIVACLVIFYVWSAFFAPPPPAEEPAAPAATTQVVPTPTVADTVPGTPAPEGPCVPQPGTISGTVAELDLANCGGGVSQVRLPAFREAISTTPWWSWVLSRVSGGSGAWVPYGTSSGAQHLLGTQGHFGTAGIGAPSDVPSTWTTELSGSSATLRRTTLNGLQISQTIVPAGEPDLFDVTYTFTSSLPLEGPLWIGITDAFETTSGPYDARSRLAAVVDGDLEQLTDPQEVTSVTEFEGPVSWFGVEDQYFLAALLPTEPEWGTLRWRSLGDGTTGAFLEGPPRIAANAPVTVKLRMYAGPKDVERMAALGSGLDEAANLGFFGFFAKILLFILHILHAGLKNWGLAILALTFTVRAAFYPLSAAAFRSGKQMQQVQPLLKELQERYKDDKEALNRETIALFTKHKVNPLGGCLPILLQMPVFFALYSALQTTPDLYQAGFLYLQDLSAPDPLGILPLIMAVGMIVQQRMTPMTGMAPAQQQIMKLMPLMFALFMFAVPAGLSLYYALNTLLSIAQQWYNTRSYKPIALED